MKIKNPIITEISSVLTIKTDYPSGHIGDYSNKNGLFKHELILRTAGKTVVYFDGKVMRHDSGMIRYLPKGTAHSYKVKTEECGECIDIYFDTDIPLFDEACSFPCESEKMKRLFNEINNIWFKKENGYQYEAMSVFYKILSLLTNEPVKNDFPPQYKKIKAGVEFINENFCKSDLDYKEISKMCGMSYSYFRRLFAACLGKAPAEYATQKRIEYAKELLMSGQYKVSEIAEIVGFCDVYYFSRVFKEAVGVPPSKYLNY